MDNRPPTLAEVDAMLARWRKGEDWRSIFRGRLETHRLNFEGTKNPLDAWTAVLITRLLGEAPPAWALDYLSICAAGIYTLQMRSAAGETITPEATARALGMVKMGAGTVYPNNTEFEWLTLAVQTRDLIREGDKPGVAIENIAKENGISESKVREAWKRFQTDCPELL